LPAPILPSIDGQVSGSALPLNLLLQLLGSTVNQQLQNYMSLEAFMLLLSNLVSQNQQSAGNETSKCKFWEPIPYEGKSYKEYQDWIKLMEEYMSSKPCQYPNEHAWVKLGANYTIRVPKKQWNQHKHTLDLDIFTWKQYKSFLHDNLKSPEHCELNAHRQFWNLHQQNKQSVREFKAEFLNHLYELNDFEPELKPTIYKSKYWVNKYHLRLKGDLQADIACASEKSQTIVEVTTLAVCFEEINAQTKLSGRKLPQLKQKDSKLTNTPLVSNNNNSNKGNQGGNNNNNSGNPGNKLQQPSNAANKHQKQDTILEKPCPICQGQHWMNQCLWRNKNSNSFAIHKDFTGALNADKDKSKGKESSST
jgi:hypothetical protein